MRVCEKQRRGEGWGVEGDHEGRKEGKEGRELEFVCKLYILVFMYVENGIPV